MVRRYTVVAIARVATLVVLVFMTACTQEGSVMIVNHTDLPLRATVDGAELTVQTGQQAEHAVYIGRRFIVGADEKEVVVTAENNCKWYFEQKVNVEGGSTEVIEVNSDAAVATFCNLTSCILDVAVYPCVYDPWDTDVLLQPLDCASFKLDVSCWKVFAICPTATIQDSLTVEACQFYEVDLIDPNPSPLIGAANPSPRTFQSANGPRAELIGYATSPVNNAISPTLTNNLSRP